MDSVNVFIHTNGFKAEGGTYYPVEIAAVEVGNLESQLVVPVRWDYDIRFSWKDCEDNEKLKKHHGIALKETVELHPFSIQLRDLKTFFNFVQYETLGCYGTLQKKVIKEFLGFKNVKNLKGSLGKIEPETVPHLHKFHDPRKEKNCALNVARTYAEAIQMYRKENPPTLPVSDFNQENRDNWEEESDWTEKNEDI